jgi:DNA-binding LytR/AlgR family response regulator
LGSYIAMLPMHSFVRIHNKHIVNVTFIHKILLSKHWSVQLLNKTVLGVSDERRKALLSAMGLVYEESKPDATIE